MKTRLNYKQILLLYAILTVFITVVNSCQDGADGCKSCVTISSCSECEIGYERYESSQDWSSTKYACALCAKGKYGGGGRSKKCSSCPTGTYNGKEGSTTIEDCIKCPLGSSSKSPATKEEECFLCPKGTYIIANETTAGCQQCEEGTFGTIEGAVGISNCTKCPIGSFSNIRQSTSCQKCPVGHYNTQPGSTSCENCPSGKTSNEDNSACIECPDGTVSYEGEECKTNCDPGKFHPQGSKMCFYCGFSSCKTCTSRNDCSECLTEGEYVILRRDGNFSRCEALNNPKKDCKTYKIIETTETPSNPTYDNSGNFYQCSDKEEEDKKKSQNQNQNYKESGSSAGIFIAIIIILVLGICGYIAYKKFYLSKNEKNSELLDKVNQVSS